MEGILHQLIGSLSHYFQVFFLYNVLYIPSCAGISSINSILPYSFSFLRLFLRSSFKTFREDVKMVRELKRFRIISRKNSFHFHNPFQLSFANLWGLHWHLTGKTKVRILCLSKIRIVVLYLSICKEWSEHVCNGQWIPYVDEYSRHCPFCWPKRHLEHHHPPRNAIVHQSGLPSYEMVFSPEADAFGVGH